MTPDPANDPLAANRAKPSLAARLRSLITRSNRPIFSRASQRQTCAIDGALVLVSRQVPIPGRIIDISSGGALFRPRQRYLIDRAGEPARMTINGVELAGHIVNTRPRGYGLRFDHPLVEHDLACVLGEAASS